MAYFGWLFSLLFLSLLLLLEEICGVEDVFIHIVGAFNNTSSGISVRIHQLPMTKEEEEDDNDDDDDDEDDEMPKKNRWIGGNRLPADKTETPIQKQIFPPCRTRIVVNGFFTASALSSLTSWLVVGCWCGRMRVKPTKTRLGFVGGRESFFENS